MSPIFILEGIVIKGKNRGKKMGFPTANFTADPKTPQGTFISVAEVAGEKFNSITFVGTVETFEEKDFVAETYMLDFDKDIYGEKIKVYVLRKIRDNQKFESVEKLIQEIEKDKIIASEFFLSENIS